MYVSSILNHLHIPFAYRSFCHSQIFRFDEVHFGKFASYYLLREYYFDVHPPFAKLLLAAAGWFVGFDGKFEFTNIGDSYSTFHVPYVGIRSLPAFLGSATVPIVYAIMKESGYPTAVAAFSACLVLFGMHRADDNRATAHLILSRQRPCCPNSSHSSRCCLDLFHGIVFICIYQIPKTQISVCLFFITCCLKF